MTDAQAKARAKKLWGDDGIARNNGKFSSAEKRNEASRMLKLAREEKEAIDAEIRERLAALDWYQELLAKRRDASKRADQAQSIALYYRFDVGKETAMGFFHVCGYGDTYEEAFAKATNGSN